MGAQVSAQDLQRHEAQQSNPFPEGFEVVSAAEAPLLVAERLQGALEPEQSSDIPLIEDPNPDTVNLPGGLVIDNEVYRQAVVRELNGEDEEHIARALVGNPGRFQHALLERGVVSVGPHKATPEILDKLLVGDLDMLILGVRRATYGDTLDMDVECIGCQVESKIRVTFTDDVPIKPLDWEPTKIDHEVELRRGTAVIRLVTGSVQRQMLSLENKTTAESNTILFAKCVVSINGEPVNGRTAEVLKLSMTDRRTLLDWLIDNQPGPQYDAVKHICDVCGKETSLNLSAANLFLGFF